MVSSLRLAWLAVFMAMTASAFGGQAEQGAPATSPAPAANALETASPNPRQEAHPVLQRRNPRYQISKGDVVDLDFPLSPEFNQSLTVQPDGFITLRGVGDVHVEGQTIPEVTQSIRQSYAKILHDPVITVGLKDFEKPYFIAAGEIGHPGKYDLRGDITVAQALAMAGGFNERAKHSQVLLFRRVSQDWVQVKKLNLKAMLRSGDLREDSHLQPGDMLYVPQNSISKIRPFIPYPSLGFYLNPVH